MGLALVACGDNGTQPIDAAQIVQDTSPAIDSPLIDSPVAVDAPADSSVAIDGGSSAAGSRVWVEGDFVTLNVNQAGEFAQNATLPVVPDDLLPSTATVGSAALAAGTSFDVSADGTQTAFVADATVLGQFDLSVANATGGSPTVLVSGAGKTIKSIGFSPDGTKVAYIADGGLAGSGAFDLYVVNTSGVPVPVQVSPARGGSATAANTLNVLGFAWSPDSKFLGFDGDLDVDTFNEMWVVDTTALLPAAVKVLATTDILSTSGSKGVSNIFVFDKSDNVYFTAHTSQTLPQFSMYEGSAGSNVSTDITALGGTRTADSSPPDIGTIGMSNDGTTLVFAADTPVAGVYNLYSHTVTSSTTTQAPALTSFSTSGGASTSQPKLFVPFAFSPDGKNVAVTATWLTKRSEPFVVSMDTSAPAEHRVVSVLSSCNSGTAGSACGSPDVIGLQYSGDNTDLFVIGDITTNNQTQAYLLDPTQTDETPTLAVATGSGATSTTTEQLSNIIVRPSH